MKSLLIRAEDKNIWERRSPLVPEDLKTTLAKVRTKAFIEKSERRLFSEKDYIKAGAQLSDNMTPGDVILGVKEIPEHKLLDNKIYLFFSHTVKRRKENMPMLKRIIDGGSTLIDYEKISDDKGRRKVFFGRYAGDAGAIDILWLMGEYWKHHGIDTPLSQCKQAVHYRSLKEARKELRKIGKRINSHPFPDEISPLVIGILGYGNVSTGAQQIFDCLPTERIEPEELPAFIESKQSNPNTVYITIFKEEHLVRHKSGKTFNLQDYYQNPANYTGQFDQYLPYISILVNATYWDNRYPRFVTWEALKKLKEDNPNPKLCGIADISCDVNGSIECNVKTTNTGMPAYLCNPLTRSVVDGHKGDGIVLLAVDNLPAELTHDSSIFFSNQLKEFIPNILKSDFNKPLEESGLSLEIQRAVIVYKGELTPTYKYLHEHI